MAPGTETVTLGVDEFVVPVQPARAMIIASIRATPDFRLIFALPLVSGIMLAHQQLVFLWIHATLKVACDASATTWKRPGQPGVAIA